MAGFGYGGTESNNSAWMRNTNAPSLLNLQPVRNLFSSGQGSYASTSQPYERQINPLLYGRAERNVEGLATQAGTQAGNVLEAQRGIQARQRAAQGLGGLVTPEDQLNTSLAVAGASNQARQGAQQQNFENLTTLERLKQAEEQMGTSRWNMDGQGGGSGGGLAGAMSFGGRSSRQKFETGIGGQVRKLAPQAAGSGFGGGFSSGLGRFSNSGSGAGFQAYSTSTLPVSGGKPTSMWMGKNKYGANTGNSLFKTSNIA